MPPTLFVENPFSFQGEIYAALLDNTTKLPTSGGWWWLGNVPKGELVPKIERRTKKESWSGERQTSRTAIKSREYSLNLTIEDLHKENIKLGLLGKNVTTAGGSVTNEQHGTLAVGNVVKLKQPNASSIVVTDSAGSPATLANNTDYKILDAKHGLIEILSLGAYTQPFKFAYTAAATLVVTGMNADDSNEYAFYCKLINTEDAPDQAMGLEVFRVQVDPTQLLAIINEDQGSLDISATGLRHNTHAADTERGGYFRFLYIDANN